MKLFKTLAVGLVAAAAINVASADVVIKITGSTAFRKCEYSGIVDWLQTNVGPVTGAYVTDSGSAMNGSNQAVFVAGTSPNKVTIQCGQGGSSGGLRFTVQGTSTFASIYPDGSLTNKTWVSASNTLASVTLASPGAQIAGGQPYTTAAAAWDAAARADITMADTYQDSTQWNSSNYDTLTEIPGGALGINAFVFAKGAKYTNVPQASYDRLTNVQPVQFQYLAATGTAPLSLFTGNSADTGIDVVLVGRDYDSGTRAVTFYENQYGNDTTVAVQYRAKDASNVDVGDGSSPGNVDHFVQATDPNGDGYAGYNSGGYVKNVLQKAGGTVLSPNGNPAIVLAYVGTGDIPSTSSQILTHQGVTNGVVSTNGGALNTNVAYGQYTFWDPEHMYYISLAGTNFSTVGTQKYVAKGIADRIRGFDVGATSAVAISAMQCSKAGEGLVISPN